MSLTRVDGVCPVCGKDTTMEVDTDDYQRFLQGEPLEEVFDYLSAQELDQLGIGLCPECYEHTCEILEKAKQRANRPKQITESIISIAVATVIIVVLYWLHILGDSAIQYTIGLVVGSAVEAHRWWRRYECDS